MFELIFIIIVIAVIVSKVKAQNQGANRNNTTYINGKPVKNNRQQVYGAGQMNRQPQNYSAGQSSRQAQPYRGAQSNRQAQPYRPQPSGRPVQNPWSQTNRGTAQSRPQKNQDILSRAKQNVQENNEDLLKNADRMQHEAARGAADTPILTPSGKVAMQGIQPVGQQIGAGFDEDCDIMQKLNDLMIMGYSGNLEFDRDFKNKLYQIIAVAKHSETGEQLVIYQALYGDFGVYARPLEMFMSEVDHEKYPDVAQKYRFERVELSSDVPAEAQKETSVQSEYEGGINPKVLEFLDSEDFDERYNILVALRDEIDDQIINTLAVALDVVIPEGNIDDRYDQLKMCLRTRQRYESNRLR